MQETESNTLVAALAADDPAQGLAESIFYTVPRFASFKEHFRSRLKTYDGGRLITCGRWQIQERKTNTLMPILYGDRRFCIQEGLEKPLDTRMGRARVTAYRLIGDGDRAAVVRGFNAPLYTRADMPDLLAAWLAARWINGDERAQALRSALAVRQAGLPGGASVARALPDYPGVFTHTVRFDLPNIEAIKKESAQCLAIWRHRGECTVNNIYALSLMRHPDVESVFEAVRQDSMPPFTNAWNVAANGRSSRVLCPGPLADPDALRDQLVCVAARAFVPQPEREKLLRAAIRAEMQAIPRCL